MLNELIPVDKLSKVKHVYKFYINSKNEPCVEKVKVVYINRDYAIVTSPGSTDVYQVRLDSIFTSYDELKTGNRIFKLYTTKYDTIYFYEDPVECGNLDESIDRLQYLGELARTYGMMQYAGCVRAIENHKRKINELQKWLEDATETLTKAMEHKEALATKLGINEEEKKEEETEE